MSITTIAATKLAFLSAIIMTGAFSETAFALEGVDAIDPPVEPPQADDGFVGPLETQRPFSLSDGSSIDLSQRNYSRDFNDNIDLGRWEEVIDEGRYTFFQDDRWSAAIEYEDDFIDNSRTPHIPGMKMPDGDEGGVLRLRYTW